MPIEQIYTGCLAKGTYYISSGREAAIIDPQQLKWLASLINTLKQLIYGYH